MLASNHLIGFGAGGLTEVLVDRTIGTHIGNMTLGGGIAAAFDGNTNQANAACAEIVAQNGYVGTTFATGKIFSRAIAYGSNDNGFGVGVNPAMTLTIYGKNGVPATNVDGTIIGTLAITDTANENNGRIIVSTDVVNSYTNIWLTGVDPGASNAAAVAELTLYELL